MFQCGKQDKNTEVENLLQCMHLYVSVFFFFFSVQGFRNKQDDFSTAKGLCHDTHLQPVELWNLWLLPECTRVWVSLSLSFCFVDFGVSMRVKCHFCNYSIVFLKQAVTSLLNMTEMCVYRAPQGSARIILSMG